MSEINGIIGLVFVGGVVSFLWWAGYNFIVHNAKANEYINWFKVGRIKQFAEEKGIDINAVIAEDALIERNKIKFTKSLEDSWTDKISKKLSLELMPIEEDLKKIKQDKK